MVLVGPGGKGGRTDDYPQSIGTGERGWVGMAAGLFSANQRCPQLRKYSAATISYWLKDVGGVANENLVRAKGGRKKKHQDRGQKAWKRRQEINSPKFKGRRLRGL